LIYTNQVDVAEKFLFDLYYSVFEEYKSAKFAADKGDIAKLRKMLDKEYESLERTERKVKEYEEKIARREGTEEAREGDTKGISAYQCDTRKIQERIRTVRNMYDGALCGCSLSPKVLATLPKGVDMYKEFLDWNIRETFGQAFSRDATAKAEGVRGFREAVHGDRNQLPASGVQRVLSNRESVESGFSKTDISRGGVEGSGETADGRSDKGRGTWGQDSHSKDTLLSRKVSGDTVREIYRELRGKGLELGHSAKTSLLSFVIAKSLFPNLPERYSFLAEDLLIASLLHDYDFTSQRGEKGPPRVDGVPLEMSEFFDKFGITPLEQQVIAAFIYRTDVSVDDEARRNYAMLVNEIKQADSELAEWVNKFAEILDYASRNANYYFAHSVNDIVNSVEQMSSELGVDKEDFLVNLPVFLKDNAINHRLYNNLKGTILAKNLEHNFRDLQEYVKNLEVSPVVTKELAQTYIQKKDRLLPDIDLIKLYADDVVNRIFTKKQNIKNLLDDYEKTVRRISDELRSKTIKAFQKLKETAQTEGGRGVSVPSVSDADVRQVVERTGQNETLRGLGDKKDDKVSDTVRSGEVKDDVSVGRRGGSVADVSQDVTSFTRQRSYGRIQRSVRLPAESLFEDLAIFVRAIKNLYSTYQKSGWVKNQVKLEGVEEKFEQVNRVIQKGDYILFDALADYINAYAGVTYDFPVDKFNKSLTIEKLRELYVRSGHDIVRLYNAVETMLLAPEILRDLYNKELAQTFVKSDDYSIDVNLRVKKVKSGEISIDSIFKQYLKSKEDFINETVKYTKELKEKIERTSGRGSVDSLHMGGVHGWYGGVDETDQWQVVGKDNVEMADTVRDRLGAEDSGVRGQRESAGIYRSANIFVQDRRVRETAFKYLSLFDQSSALDEVVINAQAIYKLAEEKDIDAATRDRIKRSLVYKEITEGSSQIINVLADYFDALARCVYNIPAEYKFNKDMFVNKLYLLYLGKKSADELIILPQYGLRNYSVIMRVIHGLVLEPNLVAKYYSVSQELAQTYIEDKEKTINIVPAEGSYVVIDNLKVNLQEVLRGDWKEDFAKDDVKKVLSGIYHAVGVLRDVSLKIAVPIEIYSDVHGWLGFDFSSLSTDSLVDPDLVMLSYGIQSLVKTNNIDIKVVPQVSIADITEFPEVVSKIEVKQEVPKTEQQQTQQEVRAPPVEVKEQTKVEFSPKQTSQLLEIPDDRILTLQEAKEIIKSHPDLKSALVDIRPISPYHQKVLLKEPSGDVVTYDMYCGKYGISIYYKGQNMLKTNLGYVYGDKLKELFRPQLELREKNLEAVKQQTLRTQTQETQQVQPQQLAKQEVTGEQKRQTELRPYPVVRVAAKFVKDYNTVNNADVVVARDNFEDRVLDLYHRFGQGRYTLTDSVVGAYLEFYKQIPYYYDGDAKINLPEPSQFNTERETFYNTLMNSFALFPEELCDKFISWYGAYLTGETGQYGAKNAVNLTQYITPLEKVTIDDLLPHLSKNLNPLNVKLPYDNTADRLRNIYEWLTRSGYEVGVFAVFDREYGEIQGVKFVRFVVLPKGQAGDISRYAEFSAKNLTSLKIPYFDIPLGSNVLETETQAKYPAGYIAIKQKGNNFKLMSLREYLLSFVEDQVAEIINKQNVDLKEWAKDVRKSINYRLQQATVYKEPVEAYKNTVVPWNMYRVVVLDENGVPISEYSNRYIDLVKLYSACYYSLREQGYDVEVYKPDSGALTLVPYSSLVFADPGKKHNFSRFNNIASSLKTPPIIALPISQVSNDFGSNIFFVVSDKYDDSLNILCDGGAWLNQNSALGKAEFYVPVKYTIELAPGVNQIIPNKIFEFISIKKELEHATGQRRDEILAQLKNFAIESKSGRIIIGDKVVNANKLYITNVSVIGGEGFGVNLIVSGNLALPSSEVSFNLGYGGAKYVPEVVSLGRSDIDLVCSLKQGDERWVEVALNAAFTRLKEMSRKEAPLTAAQRQQLEKILAKVKSAGIEVFQTDDGVIYQFRADRLDNKKADSYRDIIDSTDKLAKEVFGEGLLRTIKIRKNGHEYVFKGYYVLGYPTSTSAVYRYPISNGRLDAKFFEYISAKYGADVAVEMMKYLDSTNKTTALSCYQALYSAFVDENAGSNFEDYKVEEEYLQQALKDNKIAQEIIRELLYTTPKKVALPEGIYLAGKEQKYVFFPSLKHHFIDKPYKFFNDLEKAAFTVLLSPTQENVENYYRVLEEKTFTKDGLLSEIFEVHNDAVLNFGLVVPRGGQEYTTVEISREALLRFNGGEKLLSKLAKGEKVYAVVLRHPLISPDTLAVVELKLSDDNTPLKIHPVLWSVLKGDFDKDGAVLVTSDDMQKILSSMYRQQQTLGTARLDKQIEEKLVSLAEDYTHKNVLDEAFEKVKKTKKNAAYDIAGTIGGSLRVLTGNIHWSMYELREFVRSLYETCDLTPHDYLKYAEILWKIEQQPISGKKIADLFSNSEAEILNNPNVPIDTKLKMIESAFARNGLDVVIDLSRWNRTKTVSPVRLGHLIKWQDFVSKSARLTFQDIDEFIMLTNLYFNHRRMGLSRYREGLAAEMTRAELLNDVPVGWHLVNTLSNRHPYSYWERIVCEKLGIEFTPLPGEAVIISGQSWEKVQCERINRSVLEQTVGQAEEQIKENNITPKNPSIDLSNATGEDITTQPAQQKTETRVDEAVASSAEDTFVAEEPVVEINQKQPSSTRGIFVYKGFPVNLNRGVVIVGDLREARKFKEFVYTQKEIKNIVEEYNKEGVINGDRAGYVVDKLAYFDNNTGKYSKIPANIDYSQFVICVNDLVDALRLVEYYKIPVLAIDLNYVKFNKRDLLKTMLDCINANVKDIYVYSPRIGIGNVACFTLATLLGRVDLAVKDLKLPWIKVPYSGYTTEERIQQELEELNKKTLRNRIVRWISAGAIAVGSYLGIDYYLKHQDVGTKTVTAVEVIKGRSYIEKVDIKESSVEVAIQEEDLAHRAWEALRAEGRLPVNISYDDLVGVKYAAYRSYFREGLKQHLGIQNELTIRDLKSLSFDEVKEISLKAAKVALETADKVAVASEKTEESASQTQQTQQSTQQETQKTVVTLPDINQLKPPVIDGITIRSIAVKRGDPTSVFVNFNNDLFIKCRAVQEGDKIRLIPIGLQVNPKFMDFVSAWYTDWFKNSYDPQRGNGGYEEFNVENIDLSPEVNVIKQRNGKYIVSVFFGDALWFEKEIDVGPRGGIKGLETLPKNLRDEVRKQVREILNLPEPPAGPPIGGGLSMNLFRQLVDKADQGDEHARRVLEFYKKDFPELYYKQAQRNQMYEPKYGSKDKIVYIIVSNRPQVGKSMVSNIIAGKVGGRYIATSDVLVEVLAQKLGIKPEDIKRARAKNPEAYRKELIQLGDNLTRKWVNLEGKVVEIPTTPAEEALRKALEEGANIVVIDGIRRRFELRKVVSNIPYGYKCIKIGVFGYSQSIDNTEFGLLYDCDYVIFSRGIQSKNEVVQEIDNILSGVKEIPQHWVQKYKNTKEFVVVDLETTGLEPNSQIIQISVLKCKKQGRGVSVTDKYVTRVKLVNTNLDRDTVEEVKRITGIDLTETANEGKDIKHVLVEIEKYLLNYTIVMHNAAFDLEVLNYWRQKYGMLPFTPKVLFDTKALAKFLYPASETHLETLAKKYGVEHTNPHDAENDALVTAKVFNKLFVTNPRTSSAGSSLSNQKNELAQTYIEDEEILKSDLKNDIINLEDKDYGHKVNDTTQQGKNKDQTLDPAERDSREVDENIRRGEEKRTNKIEFQRDDKMLDIGRDISSIEEVSEEKRFERNTDRGSDGMVRSEIKGEGVSRQMVRSREKQDFLECCKKALAKINRRGIEVVLFGQGSLRAYAVLKGFEVRETKDLDFIMNGDKTRWMRNLIYFSTKGR
jgi:DNA polymerase III epsilon subunit-like protein